MQRIILSILCFLTVAFSAYANTNHGLPSLYDEVRAREHDHFAGYVKSGCLPAVPSSSLTLDTFPCSGYVSDGTKLLYVSQPSLDMTLPDSATLCIGITPSELGAAPGSWSRESSKRTHYIYQAAACSAIAAEDDVLEISEVTVAGSVITAVKNFAYRSPQDAAERVHRATSWGAVADSGATDNTTALQNALNALVNIGDTLVFPCTLGNRYDITSSLIVPAVEGISIVGESPTNPKCAPIGMSAAGEDILRIIDTGNQNNVTISGISLEGLGVSRYGLKTGTTGGQGLSRSNITHVNFNNFAGAGIGIFNSLLLNIHNSFFTNNAVGILEVDSSFTGPNGYSVVGNQFENNGIGISAIELRGWDLSGNTFQSNDTGGIKINIPEGMHIAANYFESNYTPAGGGTYYDIYLGATSFASGTVLQGNFYGGLSSYGSDDYSILRLKFVKNLDIRGETIANGSRFLKFDGSAGITGLRVGEIGFINGTFQRSGTDATFLNLPASFWNVGNRNRLEQYSHPNGVMLQTLVRADSVPLNLDNTTEPTPAGSGSSLANGRGLTVTTGATPASTVARYASALSLSRGIQKEYLDYSKAQEWEFVIEPAAFTTNGEAWVLVSTMTTPADPSSYGFGIKWDNNALKGLSHDGVTLEETDLSTTLTAADVYVIRIYRQSATLFWSVNGSVVGSTTHTVSSGQITANVLFGVANNADSATQSFTISDVKYRVTQ